MRPEFRTILFKIVSADYHSQLIVGQGSEHDR